MQLLRRGRKQSASASVSSSLSLPEGVDDTIHSRAKLMVLKYQSKAPAAVKPLLMMQVPTLLTKLSALQSEFLRHELDDVRRSLEWVLGAPDDGAGDAEAAASE